MHRLFPTQSSGAMASPCPRSLLQSNTSTRVSREVAAFRVLLWGAIFCLLARAWQHFNYDPPFRALLWSQERMEGFVNRWIGIDWNTFATSTDVNDTIDAIARGFGWIYGLAAFSLLLFRRCRSLLVAPVGLSAVGLVFLAYLQYLDANSRVGEFIEQASQWGSLFVLILCVYQAAPQKILLLARICIGCTFLGHGLYAVGFYEVPAFWTYMVMKILPLSETGAFTFLKVAGALDILLCVGIFIPRVSRYCLMYACFWGFATAAARLPGVYTCINPSGSALRAAFEFFVRTPNWALPLFVLLHNFPARQMKKRPLGQPTS